MNNIKVKIFPLLILFSIQLGLALNYLMLISLSPSILNSFSFETGKLGILVSLYSFSASLSGFLISGFIDKLDRKKVLLASIICFLVGILIFSFASSFLQLLLGQLLIGASGGNLSWMILVYLGDLNNRSKLGSATGVIMLANSIATIVAVPLAVYITSFQSWRIPFLFLAVIMFIVVVLIVLGLPSTSALRKENVESNSAKTLLRDKEFIWPAVFMSMLALAGSATIIPFISSYVVLNFAFSSSELGYVFFIGGIATLIVNSGIGLIVDRFGYQNSFILINFVSIIPIILITLTPFESKWALILAVSMFLGTSAARNIAGLSYVNALVPNEKRGQYISLNTSIQLLASSILVFVVSQILEYSTEGLLNFDLIGILAICGTFLCILAGFILEEKP